MVIHVANLEEKKIINLSSSKKHKETKISQKKCQLNIKAFPVISHTLTSLNFSKFYETKFEQT